MKMDGFPIAFSTLYPFNEIFEVARGSGSGDGQFFDARQGNHLSTKNIQHRPVKLSKLYFYILLN